MNTYITSPFQGRQSWGNGTVATWLHEGQAEYFGLLLKEDFQWKSFSLDAGKIVGSNISQQWKTDYKYLNGYTSNDSYFVGGVMYEYLLAKFGLEKTLRIYNDSVNLVKIGDFDTATRYVPFETAFESTFGQSVSSFYEEVKPYIQWSVDQANQRYQNGG